MTANLERAWRDLCTRWDRVGYSSLSVDERAWLHLRSLIDAVENGGLISYFYNSGADRLPDCRAALRDVNALKVLALVDRLAGLFGPDVPGTVEERNQIIDSWPDDDARDALLSSIDDELMPLVRVLNDELESLVVQRGLARPV
jgi:hypothetical protein